MIPWYIIKHYIQRHSKFSSCVAVLLLFTLIFFSYIKILFSIWSFIIGMSVSYCILSADAIMPNFLPMYSRKKKGNRLEDELAMMKTVCTVCGQRHCPRHRPELNILAFQPWTNLEISKKTNDALEEFLNIVLKEFVYSWYKDLSTDEEFTEEIRSNIKFVAAVLFRRAKKLDIPTLVSDKILKAGLLHLDCCIQARKRGGSDIQQATLDYLGPNVHCAMWNRKAELEYLRCLVESLFPYILRPEARQSKSTCTLVREILAGSVLLPAMDALANPDMVNNLILIFLDDTPPPSATEPPSPPVPFLDTFCHPVYKSMSCLRLELKDVLDKEKPDVLYSFMQFLKKEAAINVLQFCLSCDELNKRILSPDVSQSELHQLHSMAKELYKSYIDPSAVDKIKFEDKIVKEIKDVIESPPEQIIRLRTSFTMFQAYEHAYDLLEHTFIPLFHQSDDYYTMLCGDRSGSQSSRNSSRLSKKKDVLSNLGSKLKGVFKVNSDGDDKLFGLDVNRVADLPLPTVATQLEDLQDDICDSGHPTHDLSTWRVTIPMIGARPDPENMKRQYFVFIIEIGRADIPDGEAEKANWTVARKYGEFYSLDQKLKEFHKDLDDCQLPTKKTFGTKNQDFIESKKDAFEQYLQKLLTKPFLKSSELLYTFLTSQTEFNTSFLQDLSIGKFVKSVPMKLVKEKGQHLDPFLQGFAQSTEAPKPRSSKSRRDSDASQRSTSSEKLSTTIFDKNADCGFHPKNNSDRPQINTHIIEGAFDTLVYVATCVYYVPKWFHSMLMTLRILCKETLESYLDWYIDYKVSQVTQEHRIVSLIHLLRDVLFFDEDPPRSDDQKKIRFEETQQGCLDYVPKLFVAVVGKEIHEKRTKFVLDVLQQPKLNKQLSYVLLDILISELFPEIKGENS